MLKGYRQIKTNITIKQLKKLNPFIKSDKEAEKIIQQINKHLAINLNEVIKQQALSKLNIQRVDKNIN